MGSDEEEGIMFLYKLFREFRELNKQLTINRSEIDSLMGQVEELRGTNAVLERWLAEVRQERDDLKVNLYRITGIIRERNQVVITNMEKLPIGRARWNTIRNKLEESRRNPKEVIEKFEREVGIATEEATPEEESS